MGFQDRGYYRSPRAAGGMADWSAVNTIIAVNVAVWLANFILAGDLFREAISLPVSLNDFFCLKADLFQKPWQAWQLLTYGFLHAGPSLSQPGVEYSIWHIVFNMLTLWFFGRPVEGVTGKAEFIRFYCVAIVLSGLAWVVGENVIPHDQGTLPVLVGASGGVYAVVAVFIWYYPRDTILIYGVLPMPAWALGVLLLVLDVSGTVSQKSNVAHVAHLAGAAFGIVYAWRRMDFSALTDWPGQLLAKLRTPRLRILRPEDDPSGRSGDSDADNIPLEEEVDRLLEKISRSGEASLTPAERDALARASRRLKDRKS
jgi:membrane associated rhomboid family serine protease